MHRIKGTTQVVGIFGNPIHHTASPKLHNSLYSKLNLDFVYIPLLVDPSQIETAVLSIKATTMRGVNVTVPFKEAVIPFLDDLHPLAEQVGAVNTIINSSGRLIGYNTDVEGFCMGVFEEWSLSLNGLSCVVLGAGGAAKAICYGLLKEGIGSLSIANRSLARAESLGSSLSSFSIPIQTYDLEDSSLIEELSSADIIINATSVGLKENDCPLQSMSWVRPEQYVCDIIYEPCETQFLSLAKDKGAKIMNGIPMLAGQACLAFSYFTGKNIPYTILKKELG